MKIVLYFKKLNIGGAERSTVRLLNEFVNSGHDVTLFVWTKGGKLENELDSKVKIRYLYNDTGALDGWNRTKYGLLHLPFHNLLDAALQYVIGSFRKVYYYMVKPRFDLAITGWHGYDPRILHRYYRFSVHIQMIRNENAIALHDEPRFPSKYEVNLSFVDAYVCVSEKIKRLMLEHHSLREDKVVTIYNIININPYFLNDCSRPKEYDACFPEDTIILTICRLVDGAKGLLRMVEVCKELRSRNLHFKWFIVGDGVDRQKLHNAIYINKLEDTMILCGFSQNPIPYYKYADLVAVLSYVEGLCGTVNEAKLLQRPLIATRFSAIEEQITQNRNGLIVENNTKAIIEGMEMLLRNRSFRESLATNEIPEKLLNNSAKIRQFENLYLSIKLKGENL